MSLLPSEYLDTVVSIEMPDLTGVFHSFATGILVGYPLNKKNKKGEEFHKIFLVSNRHVFAEKKEVWIKFNYQDSIKRYSLVLIDESGSQLWTTHPDPKVDLGIIEINSDLLQSEQATFAWIPEKLMATTKQMEELGIMQGDEIFVLGFPNGLAGQKKKYVIVRSGIISRIDEEIIEDEKRFLIDSTIFPGNSGGPVILKPSPYATGDKSPVSNNLLLGIVSSYIKYTDTAVSQQTGEARISFIENSGLATVIPIDFISELAMSLIPSKNPSKKEEKDLATTEDSDIELPVVESSKKG